LDWEGQVHTAKYLGYASIHINTHSYKQMKSLARLWALTFPLASALLIAGCATGTEGVVRIGPDIYMLGGHGGYFDLSGSAVKAKYFEEAARYCQSRKQVMVPVSSTGQDSGFGTYASAEVQFRCVN